MYARVDECLALLERDAKKTPLVLCEYAHAMGNSCGGLDRHWRAFRSVPRLQCGFI